jgi:hypothetical protein
MKEESAKGMRNFECGMRSDEGRINQKQGANLCHSDRTRCVSIVEWRNPFNNCDVAQTIGFQLAILEGFLDSRTSSASLEMTNVVAFILGQSILATRAKPCHYWLCQQKPIA